MIRQNRKIQFIILLTLVCLVGTMTIAYAVLSTTLNINGTAQVMDASWNVHFENINVNPNSVPINPTITDNDKITFSADLTTPGEFYKFTVDIVNSGSIDAMIETIITNPELTADQKKYLRYEVEYVDGTPINETNLIKTNDTKTISVLLSYRNDIPTTDLPTTETNLDLEIRLVYVQATSLGTEILIKENPIKIVNGDLDTIGSEICIDKECFYLMENDGYNIKLLSKYNLLIGSTYDDTNGAVPLENPTGVQDESAKGYFTDFSEDNPIIGVKYFSTTHYWIDTVTSYPEYVYNEQSLLYEHVENYKKYLNNLGAKVQEARLITLEELESLGCSRVNNTCEQAPSWVYATTYWTGTANANDSIWRVYTDTDLLGNNWYDNNRGVRPVIIIPKYEF